jgi:hypothetical protein
VTPARGGGLVRFYLGCPEPSWLTGDRVERADRIPELAMFVQHGRLARLRRLPAAKLGWACDSGAFSELRLAGRWRTTPAEYVRAVARYDRQVGRLEWAAPQDWPCEPQVRVRTGLSIPDHQHRTVENYLLLRELWPQHSDRSCPFRPVLQGWSISDYLDCVEFYAWAGVDLPAAGLATRPAASGVVGLGSVCGRAAGQVVAIVAVLAELGVPLHGFGVSVAALRSCAGQLVSADSMSWSAHARAGRGLRMPGCTHHKCTSCLRFALDRWRTSILPIIGGHRPTG